LLSVRRPPSPGRSPGHLPLDAGAPSAPVYERRLVLVRPDGHVAWRGDSAPADSRALIARVTGQDERVAVAALASNKEATR
jgi:hypothetical protein